MQDTNAIIRYENAKLIQDGLEKTAISAIWLDGFCNADWDIGWGHAEEEHTVYFETVCSLDKMLSF